MTQWRFDPVHTSADFAVRHMMVTTVRGSIKGVDGRIEFDEKNPAKSSVEVTLDASSIFTGETRRDDHLRSADFLEAAKYPKIHFKSTEVKVTGENTGKIKGDLTIRGVTRPVTLDVDFIGQENSPFGDTRIGFEAHTKINREDWGLTWNQALETGGVLVGRDVKITIDAQAVKVVEAAAG